MSHNIWFLLPKTCALVIGLWKEEEWREIRKGRGERDEMGERREG